MLFKKNEKHDKEILPLLIDERNNDLWNSLQAFYEISIEEGKQKNYALFCKDKYCKVIVPKNQYDPASFTHELLHIWLRNKEMLIGPSIKLSIGEDVGLSRFISKELIEHIGNSLGHIKMFPEFVKLGYPPSEFISDYEVDYLKEVDTFLIEKCMCKQSTYGVLYDAEFVDQYIGKVVASLCDVNESKDYSEKLNRLRRVDENLYLVIEALIDEWKAFDHENISIYNDYEMMVLDFKFGLEDWASDKSFVNTFS